MPSTWTRSRGSWGGWCQYHGRHSANGPYGDTSEPGLSPAARGAERHIQPVTGGIAGMDPALQAAHGHTGTVPT
jgi:hypothetical protein